MVNAQEWLDKNYLNKETTTKIKRKHFTETLEGELVIENFPNLQKINVSSFRQGKLTKLKIVNCPQLRKLNCENNQLEELEIDEIKKNYPDEKTRTIYLRQQLEGVLDCSYEDEGEIKGTEIILCIPIQTYLEQNYPKNGTCQMKSEHFKNFGKKREEVKKLSISDRGLEGNLDLSDFTNLEEFYCPNNCLTNLNLNNCQKLKDLKELEIGNRDKNKINQGIYNRGLEYLPDRITHFSCLVQQRLETRCQVIYNLFANSQGEVETYGV
ncbi:hypothetical protein C1645_841642 [Glomus cerebriforme]|uniref:Uncharacterized protein n=1 Tax=Glomus cerebriforme TaxID=658196 RepID=A0A397S9Q7_9GLOM|nr:hypothetical protein C1645_841642 [Glomus cerebriforme]